VGVQRGFLVGSESLSPPNPLQTTCQPPINIKQYKDKKQLKKGVWQLYFLLVKKNAFQISLRRT